MRKFVELILMKADLDIAIVIPSYDEGEDISSTLRSIIMSLDHVTESVKVGVFVVINNSQNSSEEVKKSNQKTLEYIQEGGFIKNPEGEGHRQYFRAAKDSSVFFEVINMFSNENAPNICNVGVACHQGFTDSTLGIQCLSFNTSLSSEFVNCIDPLLGWRSVPVVVGSEVGIEVLARHATATGERVVKNGFRDDTFEGDM